MTGLVQDFRYALRQLRKSPGFTAVVVITLALAVGANTAIFSVVHAVLLVSLPYRHVDRLAMIWGRNPSRGDMAFPLSAGDFTEWKQKNDSFEDIAASFDDQVTLTGSSEPRLILGYAFTPNYFNILGVAPRIGRTFTEQEAESRSPLVVLSDRLWRTIFHADQQIVGRPITLDSKPYTVIGVMPPGFDYPPQTELWMPMAVDHPDDYAPEHRFIRVIGRLKPEISMAEAQVRMNALERQIAAAHPATDAGNETWVEPLRHELTGGIRTPLLALSGAVGLVLLIACANIAGLLLAKTASRRGEVSLRIAIGASRFHLIRQFLCESLILSLFGGALGIALAFLSTRFLLAIFPNGVANLSIPRVEAIPINDAVLWFALGITVLTGVIFGSIPALQSARADANEAIKEFRGSRLTARPSRTRHLLVAAEIALSVILLAGGSLMIKSLRQVYHEDLGFGPEHLLALEVLLPGNRYPENPRTARDRFVSNVIDKLNGIAGVESVAATTFLPLSGFWGTTDFAVPGQIYSPQSSKPQADNRLTSPGYFSTMRIRFLRGRDFTRSDRPDTEKVAIVNETLSRRYFGGSDPVDRVLDLGDTRHPDRWRIVGEVADVKAFGPEQPAHADLYRSLSQVSFPLLSFMIRTSGDPSALLKTAEQAIWSVDKDQPVFDAMPMTQLAAQSITLRRTGTILLAGFAGLGLIIAALGLYGLIAFLVAQRTHEFGIRMALGAKPADVLRQVLRSGLVLIIAGEVVGLLLWLITTRAVSGVFYRVSPIDPSTLAIAIFTLTIVALLACYVPARRATRVDPMVALRYE
jgi:predicted permease